MIMVFLCGWNNEGKHLNYNEIECPIWDSQKKAMQKVIEANVLIMLHSDIYKLNSERE